MGSVVMNLREKGSMILNLNKRSENEKGRNMKKQDNTSAMQRVVLGLVGFTLVLMTGCTKERPYDKLRRDDFLVSKKLISTQDSYVASASTGATDHSAPFVIPFFLSDTKRVQFQMDENHLFVYELEVDDNFKTNNLNKKPMYAFPIKHIDYQCAEDSLGKCQHKEEENKDIGWYDKKFIEIDVEDLMNISVEGLPLLRIEKFNGCVTKKASKLVEFEVDENNVNLIVENLYTFRDFSCANIKDYYSFTLSDLSFSVQHHYSFAKAKTVLSESYQPVNYPRVIERYFGFFKTVLKPSGVDQNIDQDNEVFYMNRWNPNRSKIDFYMSEEFNFPQNAVIKEATYKAVNVVNDGLVRSGAKFRVNLKEPKPGMRPGNIRNNMIVLVEDKNASRISGYGPSLADPLTGEIFKANTVMYLGNLKSLIKRTYNEMVEKKLRQVGEKQVFLGPSRVIEKVSQEFKEARKNLANEREDERILQQARSKEVTSQYAPSQFFTAKGVARVVNKLIAKKHGMFDQFENSKLKEVLGLAKKYNDGLEYITSKTGYPMEYVEFHTDSVTDLAKLVDDYQLKYWIQLTDKERKRAMDVLLPYYYLPVLTHEIGHNLGLRHNFQSSEDKDNWYTKEELQYDFGFSPGTEFKHSSVMDYGHRTHNELHLMGKYDVAAFKFAYAEKVESVDGSEISLYDFVADHSSYFPKPYGYCSDEMVSPNPNCNRHDEGTNMVEIMQHKIRQIEEVYERANYRLNRVNFSTMSDSQMIGYYASLYQSIRLHFERMESLVTDFGWEFDNPIWETGEFVLDLKESAVLGAKYLIEVVKTPGKTCGFASVSDPTQLAFYRPLVEIPGAQRAMDCFDPSLEDFVGETGMVNSFQFGKPFASRKYSENPNIYADQIDVRGFYINKILATHFLFARELGTSIHDGDGRNMNYLDFPAIKVEIDELIEQILFDEVKQDIQVTEALVPKVIPWNTMVYSLGSSHIVENLDDVQAKKMLGLPSSISTFNDYFIRKIWNSGGRLQEKKSADIRNKVSLISMQELEDLLSYEELNPDSADEKISYKTIKIAGQAYAAIKGVHTVAYGAMEALEAIDVLTDSKLVSLDQIGYLQFTNGTQPGYVPWFDPETKIVVSKNASVRSDIERDENGRVKDEFAMGTPISDEALDKILSLPDGMLPRFVSGALQGREYYQNLILKLAKNMQ